MDGCFECLEGKNRINRGSYVDDTDNRHVDTNTDSPNGYGQHVSPVGHDVLLWLRSCVIVSILPFSTARRH